MINIIRRMFFYIDSKKKREIIKYFFTRKKSSSVIFEYKITETDIETINDLAQRKDESYNCSLSDGAEIDVVILGKTLQFIAPSELSDEDIESEVMDYSAEFIYNFLTKKRTISILKDVI